MLTQQQKDLIFGTLLGDGNLQTENKGRTWRYRALHKGEHKEYLDHKYMILKPLCTSPPVEGTVLDPRNNATYTRHPPALNTSYLGPGGLIILTRHSNLR